MQSSSVIQFETQRASFAYTITLTLPDDTKFTIRKTGWIVARDLDPMFHQKYTDMIKGVAKEAKRVLKHFKNTTPNFKKRYEANYEIDYKPAPPGAVEGDCDASGAWEVV